MTDYTEFTTADSRTYSYKFPLKDNPDDSEDVSMFWFVFEGLIFKELCADVRAKREASELSQAELRSMLELQTEADKSKIKQYERRERDLERVRQVSFICAQLLQNQSG